MRARMTRSPGQGGPESWTRKGMGQRAPAARLWVCRPPHDQPLGLQKLGGDSACAAPRWALCRRPCQAAPAAPWLEGVGAGGAPESGRRQSTSAPRHGHQSGDARPLPSSSSLSSSAASPGHKHTSKRKASQTGCGQRWRERDAGGTWGHRRPDPLPPGRADPDLTSPLTGSRRGALRGRVAGGGCGHVGGGPGEGGVDGGSLRGLGPREALLVPAQGPVGPGPLLPADRGCGPRSLALGPPEGAFAGTDGAAVSA